MKNFEDMPFKEWDGETPLVLFNDDKYFFSPDEVEDYLQEINDDIENVNNHKTLDDLQLVIAEPSYLWQLDFNDIYCDILPEDQYLDDVASKDVLTAIEAYNAAISNHKKPVSWSYGKFRTTFNNVIYITSEDLNQE